MFATKVAPMNTCKSHCALCENTSRLMIIEAVQAAVGNGFGQVGLLNIFTPGDIGDGAGKFENAVIGAGGELKLVHGFFQQHPLFIIQAAVYIQLG